MTKYLVLLITGSLLIGFVNCSNNEFARTDSQSDGLSCDTEDCSIYTVTDNANNPLQNKKADILFVFDNSPSMVDENNELANKMNGFIQALNNNKVDYNLCYTLSEPTIYNSGRIQPWVNNSLVVNKNTPNLTSVFYNTVDMVNDNTAQTGDEQPIAATYAILNNPQNSDCFRSNAAVNVVFLTDEDENSNGTNLGFQNQPTQLISKARSRFGNVPFMVHSIIAAPDNFNCFSTTNNIVANTHYNLSQLTGGIVGNICSNNYANQLDEIFTKISETLDSVALRCTPLPNTLNITSSNNINYASEIKDGRLFLTPGIPEDSSVTITYKCSK